MIDRYRHLTAYTPNHRAIGVPHQLWRAWCFRAATLPVWNLSARALVRLAGLQVEGLGMGLALRRGNGSARRWAHRRNCEARNGGPGGSEVAGRSRFN
jgi:hypothetical protein